MYINFFLKKNDKNLKALPFFYETSPQRTVLLYILSIQQSILKLYPII